VLVVDDDADVRALVRACLEIDGRFEVVAEVADGQAAVDRVTADPDVDVVVLDRDMPVMDGLTALPLIHERAPGAEIVLYTARADAETKQAAVTAGAAGIVDKRDAGMALVERLTDTLLDRWGAADDDAEIRVRIGPVPSAAALAWVTNSAAILDAFVAHPEMLDVPIVEADAARFRQLLDLWRQFASTRESFCWIGTAAREEVERLVRVWAALDSVSDEQIAALGCAWSPPEARPFYEALTRGVVAALERHHETQDLARTLSQKWGS
jgi:CheY-like chemotaxis protein